MTLYIVRHAKAGKRSEWEGPDEMRPLSDKGWEQAQALAEKLKLISPTNLISSPATRCIQTLKPLSKAINIKIVSDQRLFEHGDIAKTLEVLEEVEDSTVISSHGDMIPEVIKLLERRGMEIGSKPDWRKASVWVVERTNRGFKS
ncbi:MAG: histidine phosphatase family protein, partial [Ilumatobacteraceae bacterium]|nr:histidine phosphatase family protein [Ilumatobacteraceae bacterium]